MYMAKKKKINCYTQDMITGGVFSTGFLHLFYRTMLADFTTDL